jgi:hypothetical protein
LFRLHGQQQCATHKKGIEGKRYNGCLWRLRLIIINHTTSLEIHKDQFSYPIYNTRILYLVSLLLSCQHVDKIQPSIPPSSPGNQYSTFSPAAMVSATPRDSALGPRNPALQGNLCVIMSSGSLSYSITLYNTRAETPGTCQDGLPEKSLGETYAIIQESG